MHAPSCGPVPAAKFGSSGREYEAPCHALEIPGPHQVAVGCHGRLELRALGFAPDGLACADVRHRPRAFGCYRHVFGRRRTNARFRGSQSVGSIAHTLIESRPRAFSPASWFAPPHALRTTGRTVALHPPAEEVSPYREEASAALSHETNPNATTRRAAQGAFSEGYGLAGGSLFHGQAGDPSSCPLSVLAHSLGAPSAAWSGGRYAGPRVRFLLSTVETFHSRQLKLGEARHYRGRSACFRFHYVTPGKGDMVADDRARAFQDPTLLWWDETAQLLRRVRTLRSTNPMARQLRAVYEALGRRISTEERPNWCNALHAADEIEDQELENLIACALVHAKQAFRGLAGELDRRVRAWIRANSTMGAGALHKWAARDNLAPRLPQQALDSEGSRLPTPREMLGHWRAKWSTRWQQHRDRFLQLRLAICKLRHEIRSGDIEHGLVGGIHPDTLRAQAQLYKTEAGMGADRWRAQDLANLPQQAFSALGGFLETCERELAWPPQWLAIFTSLLSQSEVDERPIAVAPLLYRLWCRARGHEADDWCSATAGFWDTAVRGSSALRAGIQRMLMNETNQWLQYRFAVVCWDLEKFYDSICLHRLITSMVALSFPPAIIVMTFTMYLSFARVVWARSREPI